MGNDAARSAIVTGGASGIGRAIAEELAARGVGVVLADRQVDLGEQVAAGIRERGGAATVAELDVRNRDRFRAVVRATFDESGRLDYLFNNAGIGIGAEMAQSEAADWDDVIDVNLRGVVHGVLAAYPLMIEQGFGHIVNTASMAGLISVPYLGSYTATKHAVVGLSRALRLEARPHGIRISALCPGVIRTPILNGGRYGRVELGIDPDQVVDRIKLFYPMDPSLFARRVVSALERDPAIIIYPRWWRLLWYLERLSPWLNEKIGARLFDMMRSDIAELRSQTVAEN